MNDVILITVKILFLLGFSLHNLEEAIWLPEWSKHAKKYSEPVEKNKFIFAIIIITITGYLISLCDILLGARINIFSYIYMGFIGMMGLNAIFPHIIATFVLKKYAPGLITGVFLNLPLSVIIIGQYLQKGINIYLLIVSVFLMSVLTLLMLKYLFNFGSKFIKY